jgi:CubicO group peptidase (beta-lactamase class C family)
MQPCLFNFIRSVGAIGRHFAALSLLFAMSQLALAQNKAELPRSTPEAQGISSAALLSFVDQADRQIETMNSFLLVRHGHVVAEGYWTPYDAKTRHALYSLTKSFTSTAVGLAVAEGRLSIDDLVLPMFPEDAPAEPGSNLKSLRVRDLLSMSTGQHSEARNRTGDHWTKNFLAHPFDHKPGTYFLYNTPSSHMLSAIVQKRTGLTTLEYLRPRLFNPLGIADPVWMSSPQGVSSGGWGLKLRTAEIARFGQLYLQRGKWQGRQLVPETWIAQATSRQVSNGSNPASDWEQGYGYQFWRTKHGNYRGDGAFGQYCVVIPEQDAVIVITSGVKNMQAVLDLVWSSLLPVFKSTPLPADRKSNDLLGKRLGELRVKSPVTVSSPAIAKEISGREFIFPANDSKFESLRIDTSNSDETVLTLRLNGAEKRIVIGSRDWKKGDLAWGDWALQPVASTGGWTATDTFRARLCFYEEPFILDLNLKFNGDEVTFDSEFNVSFGFTRQQTLKGVAKR